MGPLSAVLRHTALETLRARTLVWAGATFLLLFGASLFLRELALTDSERLQTTFLGATIRFAAAFTVAAVIIGAVVREFNEHTHLVLLSLPVGRGRYLLGRFLGFGLVALLVAATAGLVVSLAADGRAALVWTLALALELLVVAAMALFAAVGLRQLLPAFLVTGGFYLLARAIGGLQLLAHAGGGDGLAWATDALALLLPALDGFATSAHLTGEGPPLADPLVQTFLYCALLLAAAATDVARRDL